MSGCDYKQGEHLMSSIFGRRTVMVATAAALSVGALLTTAGSASANDEVPISVGHSVGLYVQPNTWDGKVPWPDVAPGQAVIADCWTVGQSIGAYGDTWYRVTQVNYNDARGWQLLPYDNGVYVFAGYADGNARSVNRDPYIPRC